MQNGLLLAGLIAVAMLSSACGPNRAPQTPGARTSGQAPPHSVIPLPAAIDISTGPSFAITPTTQILYEPSDDPRVESTAAQLAKLLASALPSPPAVRPASGAPPAGSILLSAGVANANLGEEGYELTIAADGVRIAASTAAGLFYGVQTFRQLLPWSIEYQAARPRPRRGAARQDSGSAALRLARRDARRRPPLLRRRRGQALHRPDRALQDQPSAPAPLRRSGLAHRDQVVAEPDGPRRTAPRSAAAPAASTRRPSTRTSCATRAIDSSRSFPRSTCPATPTRRSPRIRS